MISQKLVSLVIGVLNLGMALFLVSLQYIAPSEPVVPLAICCLANTLMGVFAIRRAIT